MFLKLSNVYSHSTLKNTHPHHIDGENIWYVHVTNTRLDWTQWNLNIYIINPNNGALGLLKNDKYKARSHFFRYAISAFYGSTVLHRFIPENIEYYRYFCFKFKISFIKDPVQLRINAIISIFLAGHCTHIVAV